ncbi:MAG: trehalose-phosphatase [Anaerolineales bacterium]|nr:trehalose-phosphatase [Anaerolineales bacterium]
MKIQSEHYQQLLKANQIWLLLDYDGTLADFAPTPDDILPDDDLISLIGSLAELPRTQVGVLSGRRLAHIEKLLPLESIWRAGSYGLELRLPGGERLERLPFDQVRPPLAALKPHWSTLIAQRDGFYLEDKGWSLAIHARFAEKDLAEEIIAEARELATGQLDDNLFTLLGGHKFLEAAPQAADKGQSIRWLLERFGQPGALPIYLGDDDKDERAFPVVQELGGFTGCVCSQERQTVADFRLASPQHTRAWLRTLQAELR